MTTVRRRPRRPTARLPGARASALLALLALAHWVSPAAADLPKNPPPDALDGAATLSAPESEPARQTWERTLGDAFDDRAHAAAALPGGGWGLIGASRPGNGARHEAWALRVDGLGRLVWETRLPAAFSRELFGATATPDGGLLAVGHTRELGDSDAWIVRFGAGGNIVWRRRIGGDGEDRTHGVAASADGGYFVAGFTGSQGEGARSAWLLKIGPSGDTIWERTFGAGRGGGFSAVAAAPDGGVYATGLIWSDAIRGYDMIVMRLDAEGAPVWWRHFDSGRVDTGLALAVSANGDVTVVGSAGVPHSLTDDVWAIRLSDAGEVRWSKRFGGGRRDTPWGLAETADGGMLIAAGTWSQGEGSADAWILKLDVDGELRWARLFGGPVWDRPTSILTTAEGGMLMVGHTSSKGAGYEDIWLLKLDSEGRL